MLFHPAGKPIATVYSMDAYASTRTLSKEDAAARTCTVSASGRIPVRTRTNNAYLMADGYEYE